MFGKIWDKIATIYWELFQSIKETTMGECSFKTMCNLYQKDSFTCNYDAGSYCGKYRQLSKQK